MLVPKSVLYEGDGEALPLPDDFAEVILCMHCFHHFPYPEKALSEMYKTLRPGEQILITENDHPFFYRFYKNNFVFKRLKFDHGDVRFYSRKQLTVMMEKAGFTDIKYTPEGKPFLVYWRTKA